MRILKNILSAGLFVLAGLLAILTLIFIPYALFMVAFINVPLADVLKLVVPAAILTIALACVCAKAGQALSSSASTLTAE